MEVSDLLQQYGLAGLVITSLATVCIVLYKKVDQLSQKLLDVQEARRVETLETQKQLMQTLSSFSQSTQLLVDKIVEVQRRGKG